MKRKLWWFWLCVILVVSCHHRPPVPPPPPTAWSVACVVYDADTHRPIQGAHCQDGTLTGTTNQDGYAFLGVATVGPHRMTAQAVGYTDGGTDYTHDSNQNIEVDLHATWPQPENFPPLSLETDDHDGLRCSHDLPSGLSIPVGPTVDFWRGDAWGVTILGLPSVPGGSPKHPERALSWFLDRYSLDWQTAILQAYRRRGYTHFALSYPDSRAFGTSDAEFVQLAQRVKAAIPYVAVFLTSKDYDPRNADAATRMAAITGVVDSLIAHLAIDVAVVGWELDTFNQGQLLEDFIAALANRYPGLPLFVHFTSYKTSWQPDGQPRAQFWQFFRRAAGPDRLIGLLYQANQDDPCGLMQAHFQDAMIPPSGLEAAGAILVPWEIQATNSFYQDHPTEDEANARGWEMMATPGRVLASGFGEGARYPNGQPTLSHYSR